MAENQRQAYGLTILKNNHAQVRRLRKQTGLPSIHGNKFWKSTYLLMDYLHEYPPKAGARVLEIGCGWGLGGIFCAKAFNSQVTALDADEKVFPYLQLHAELNGVSVETWKCRYERVRKIDLKAFDVVIAADVCFWDSMVNPLYNLVRRAHQAGDIRVVMSDPGRSTFRQMAGRCEESMDAEYNSWYAPEPNSATGVVLELRV